MAIGQDNREREGSEDKTVGEGETTNSDVSNRRRHSGRAATDVTENSLSLPRGTASIYYTGLILLFH
jgi:hypothetical protein